MMILAWSPITEIERIPPLGRELYSHINNYHGRVKYASCSAWTLLYDILFQYSLPCGSVTFTDKGKPLFLDQSVFFSISHSKDVCAVAVSDNAVGVDVECYDRHISKSLIEKSLSVSEKKSYKGDFIQVWCRKEAISKMTGEGILEYPKSIDTNRYNYCEKSFKYKDSFYWIVAVNNKMCIN